MRRAVVVAAVLVAVVGCNYKGSFEKAYERCMARQTPPVDAEDREFCLERADEVTNRG